MSTILASLTGKAGITLLLVAACLFFTWRIIKILNPKPPRPPKPVEYRVKEVLTGNSIEVYTGRRDKRTATVTLSGIGVPSLQEESRAHLERLAGNSIRVEVKRRGLLRGTETALTPHTLALNEVAYDESNPISEAMVVDGDNTEWSAWYEKHVKGCLVCQGKEGEGPPPLCKAAFTKLQEILRKDCVEIDCYVCGGTGKLPYPDGEIDDCYRCGGDGKWWTHNPPEARGPIIGVAYGETGLCLQLEMLRAGFAISVGDVPKPWAKAEKAAKKAERGIWGGL